MNVGRGVPAAIGVLNVPSCRGAPRDARGPAFRRFGDLQYRHHRALSHALAPLGLSLVQWDTLRHLHQRPDAALRDLAVLTFQLDQLGDLLALALGPTQRPRPVLVPAPGPRRAR